MVDLSYLDGYSEDENDVGIEVPEEPLKPIDQKTSYLEEYDEGLKEEEVEKDEGENEIHSRMYKDMSYKEATEKYKELKAQADVEGSGYTSSFLGGLQYTDPESGIKEGIPMPDQGFFSRAADLVSTGDGGLGLIDREVGSGDAKVSFADKVARGFVESFGDAGVFGAALLEKYVNSFPQMDGSTVNFTEEAEKRVLNFDTSQSVVDSLIADGIPAVVGGGGIGGAGFKLLKNSPRALRWIGTEILAGAGAAITMGTEEETLAVGENAAFKLFDGLDMGDEAADNAIETRVNALAEGIGLVAGLKVGVDVGLGASKVIYNLLFKGVVDSLRPTKSTLFRDGLDKKVFEDLMFSISQLKDTASPEEIARKQIEIAEIVRNNKEVVMHLLEDVSETDTVVVDTISALIRGGELDDAGLLAFRKGQQLKEVATGGDGKLTAAINRPVAFAEQTLANQRAGIVADSADGASTETGVLQSGTEAIVDEGQRIVDGANDTLAAAEADFLEKSSKILPTDANDLEFIDAVQRLEEAIGLGINTTKERSLNELKEGLRNGFEALSNEKNRLYGQIKGGEVDAVGIVKVLDELSPNQLDAAYLGLPEKSPLALMMNNLRSVRSRANATAAEAVENGDLLEAEVGDFVKKLTDDGMSEYFSKNNLDYEKLYTEIRPAVSSIASTLFGSGTPIDTAAGRVLRDFVRYIDEDGLDFAATGDDALRPLVDDARTFYEKTFAPLFRGGGVLEEYADLYNSTIGRTNPSKSGTARLDGTEFKRAGYDENLDDMLVQTILGQDNPERVSELVRLLREEEVIDGVSVSMGRAEAALDYMIFDVVNNFADTIRASGMQGADFSTFSSQLQKYTRSLSEAFPEKADVLDQLVRNLDAAKGSQEELLKIMDQAKQVAKSKKEEIQQKVFGKFLDTNATNISFLRGNDTLKATGNYMEAFTSMFNGKNSINDVRDLLALANTAASASEQKIIKDGIRLAFNKHATSKIFTLANQNIDGTRDVSVAAIAAAEDGMKPLISLAEEIYGADSEWTSAFTKILNMTKVTSQGLKAQQVPGQSSTAYTQAAMTSTSNFVNIIFGPLTRMGTRTRTGIKAYLGFKNPDDAASKIMINLLSNPDEFLALADKFNKAPNDPLVAELMQKVLLNGVKIGYTAENEEGIGFVDNALEGAASTVSSIQDTASSVADSLMSPQ